MPRSLTFQCATRASEHEQADEISCIYKKRMPARSRK
jgi:hypothetical protein